MELTALKELLKDMSLEEKINQLLQLPSSFFEEGVITGPAQELGIEEENVRQAGSCLSVIGAGTLKKIQDEYMAKQPHRIPMLFMCDIINGYRTVFPIPLAQGCTFDPELVEECAQAAAREAAASGLHVNFSPMADLVRDPRWGRVMESTGEDVYLNSRMAKAMVKGYQGDNLADKGRIAACLKHFAAYGAPTGGRDYNNVELSERTLREDYLPAYKAAVDAGCALVMTSFNSLNRIPSSANRELLRGILREEMGFDGVIISDWAALNELLVHGIAKDEEEAAYLGIEAGVDIDMTTNIYVTQLKKLVEKGRISTDLIDEAVFRVLQLKNRLGLFENPYKDGDEAAEQELHLCEEHRRLSRICAEESFVLLKNDGVLPLPKEGSKIAFIGPYTEAKGISGSWSFFADEKDNVSLREGIEKKLGTGRFVFETGCGILEPGEKIIGFKGESCNSLSVEETRASLKRAVEEARKADIVVLAVGEHKDFTGEGTSSAMINIPEHQMELLRKIREVNENIVVVLFNGRPLELKEVSSLARAVLDVWMPGTEGGPAIANVLFGDVNPSGRLSMSFPYSVGQVPVFYSEFSTGRPFAGDYREGRFASKYRDIPNAPLYPFGYGLSYTQFTYSGVELDSDRMDRDGTIRARVTVTNSGTRAGWETVQLYIRDLAGSVIRPVRELKGIKRVWLEPSESLEAVFEIRPDMLKFYGADMTYDCEPGQFKVFIGSDSTTENQAQFTLC